MEYLQYSNHTLGINQLEELVLNLIINGIPSILELWHIEDQRKLSFKPYYKWNT